MTLRLLQQGPSGLQNRCTTARNILIFCQNSLQFFIPVTIHAEVDCHTHLSQSKDRMIRVQSQGRAELPKPCLVPKLEIPSIIYFARKYFLLLLLRVVLGSKEKRSSYQLFIFFQRIITTSLMGQLRPFSYNSVLLKPQNLCSQPEFIIHIKPKLKSIVAKTFQMLF